MQVLFGVGEAGLVLAVLGNGLIECGPEGCRVDLHKQLALINHLALVKGDPLDLPVHSGAHGHGVCGLHRTQTIKDNWKRLGLDNGCMNGRSLGGGARSRLRRRAARRPRCRQPQPAAKAMANRSSKASQAERVLSRCVACAI